MSAVLRPSIAELRTVVPFADLAEEQLAWFAANSEVRRYEAGEILFREGAPAEDMYLVLAGEVHGRPRNAPDRDPYIVRAGDVGGMLPFSRMKNWGGTGRVEVAARLVQSPLRASASC